MRLRPYAYLLLAGLLQFQPLSAQESPQEAAEELLNMPPWLVEFSNLPRELRETYISTFNRAKLAFHQGRWIDCITLLAECEVIQRGNPNVWNLRASCLLEQRYYAEAEAELKRVLEVLPNDPVSLMNLSSVHMVGGRYAESLAIVKRLREDLYLQHKEDELLYVLDYRALLCHLLMGQTAQAKAIAGSVSPVSDTPLYYYAKVALALTEGNKKDAAYYQGVVRRIFANNGAFVPYERALAHSGLPEKPPVSRQQ